MTRLRRVPLRIFAEYLVCQLFLLLGHRVVEGVERRDQLLQMLDGAWCGGVRLHRLRRQLGDTAREIGEASLVTRQPLTARPSASETRGAGLRCR